MLRRNLNCVRFAPRLSEIFSSRTFSASRTLRDEKDDKSKEEKSVTTQSEQSLTQPGSRYPPGVYSHESLTEIEAKFHFPVTAPAHFPTQLHSFDLAVEAAVPRPENYVYPDEMTHEEYRHPSNRRTLGYHKISDKKYDGPGFIGDPCEVVVRMHLEYLSKIRLRSSFKSEEEDFIRGAQTSLYYIMAKLRSEEFDDLDLVCTESGKKDCELLLEKFADTFFVIERHDLMEMFIYMHSLEKKSASDPSLDPVCGEDAWFVTVRFYCMTGEHYHPTNKREIMVGFVRQPAPSATVNADGDEQSVCPDTWFVHHISSVHEPFIHYHEKLDEEF